MPEAISPDREDAGGQRPQVGVEGGVGGLDGVAAGTGQSGGAQQQHADVHGAGDQQCREDVHSL